MSSSLFPFEIPQRSFHESAQYVIDRLGGCKIGSLRNPQNRFMHLSRVVLESNLPRALDLHCSEGRLIAQAVLDVQEMAWVLTVLGDEAWKGRFAAVLKRTASDSACPNIEDSPGRNAQLELFVGAIAERACLEPKPVSPGPEWLISDGDDHSGAIECKRVRSEKKVWEKLTEANSQFHTVGRSGFVVLDIALLDKSHDGLDIGDHPFPMENIEEWMGTTAASFVEGLERKGEHLSKLDRVATIILYSPFVGQVARNGKVNGLSAYHPFILFPPWSDHPARKSIEPLVRRFMDAAPGMGGHV
jgi:hypothetical protein